MSTHMNNFSPKMAFLKTLRSLCKFIVNFPALLVLLIMYINALGRLPATSYMKMVDVWFMFLLGIVFCHVILHTISGNLRVDDGRLEKVI